MFDTPHQDPTQTVDAACLLAAIGRGSAALATPPAASSPAQGRYSTTPPQAPLPQAPLAQALLPHTLFPHTLLAQMLDEVDYGMLLLADDARVIHINKAARRDLDDKHPLQLQSGRLDARQAHEQLVLAQALAAAERGLRRLLSLGAGQARVSLAVVPLPHAAGLGQTPAARAAPAAKHAVLLVLGRRRMCEELTIDWYARSHALTHAETAVVKGLCADLSPQQVADLQGVGLATVRSQIAAVRVKTGMGSIKAIVRQVALLPPLVSALRGGADLLACAPRSTSLAPARRPQPVACAAGAVSAGAVTAGAVSPHTASAGPAGAAPPL